MLANLHVKNFALIDEADIEFGDHLNILTGETGAGKSIVLGAVNLALGARTGKDVIRTGADYALAELTFTEVNDTVASLAAGLGLDMDDREITISRKLMSNGRNIVRVNGETFSTASVRELTGHLIDIYGQNEHQSLTDVSKHLELIDRYASVRAEELLDEIGDTYHVYASLRKEMDSLQMDDSMRQRDIDRISYEISEIEEAELKDGEEEELKSEHKLLANQSLISEALSCTDDALYGRECVSDLLSGAIKSLSRVSEFDERLASMYDSLSDIDGCVSDLHREIESYMSDMPDAGERIEYVEKRLDLYSRLKSKYGRSVAEIEDYLEQDKAQLKKLEDYVNYSSDLSDRLSKVTHKLERLSSELSRVRHEAAEQLKTRISSALLDLNFNQVVFEIEFTEREGLHPDGTDCAQFLISLNPGEDPKPLSRIASGGELSRIMLAVKSVMAVRDDIGTLIFDEIDAGISGRTAQKVAEKLAGISGAHQVMCITHLPQIAAMSDRHFSIEKSVEGLRTHVEIRPVGEDGVINELARLLSGAEVTQTILDSAVQIRHQASETKTSIRNLED